MTETEDKKAIDEIKAEWARRLVNIMETGIDEFTETVIDEPRSLEKMPIRTVIDINHKWELIRNEMEHNPLMPLNVAMSRVAAMFTILPLR
jgi:hypothetical protein